MSGNCATGMRSIDSTPASVMTMAMTIASRGRSTKTPEITRVRPRRCRPSSSLRRPRAEAGHRRGWAGADQGAGAHALQALDDHPLALLQPGGHRGDGGRGLAERDAALLHLVLGVRPRRRNCPAGRTAPRRAGSPAPPPAPAPPPVTVTNSPSVSARSTGSPGLAGRRGGLAILRAHQHRVGVLRHRRIDVVEVAAGLYSVPSGRRRCTVAAPKPPLAKNFCSQLQLRLHRDREQHVHRVLADDGRERPAAGRDDVADGDQRCG